MRRFLTALGAAATAALVGVLPAAACGGLVAPNGAVRLSRATTLVAYHAGVEHYLTSFAYQGVEPGIGWIVPLPAVPDSVTEGGSWTLQRLQREVAPPRLEALAFAGAAAKASADVLLQTRVRALDITVLRGSGQAVIDWCTRSGFVLPAETRDHLLAYAKASPVFMAARYDILAAAQRGQVSGDGTPVLITMHVPHLWVPLEVLAGDDGPVDADLFLLTDGRPTTGTVHALLTGSSEGDDLPGAPGFTVQRQEDMPPTLRADLASDRNMAWVPQSGVLTYLRLHAPGDTVDYDMSVTRTGLMRLDPLGAGAAAVDTPPQPRFTPAGDAAATLPALAATGAALLALAAVAAVRGRRRAASA